MAAHKKLPFKNKKMSEWHSNPHVNDQYYCKPRNGKVNKKDPG